jgi:hypothetical protein
MSDQPVGQMSNEELISALRRDLADTSHLDAADQVAFKAERQKRLATEAQVNALEAAAKDASMPDAEIRVGLHALWHKLRSPF